MPLSLLKPLQPLIILYKPWRPEGFLILNHHKCLSQLFPFHLNTYVMRLLPLAIFQLFNLKTVFPANTKHLYNIYIMLPASKTLGQRCINVMEMFCVCCVYTSESWSTDVRFWRIETVPALKGLTFVANQGILPTPRYIVNEHWMTMVIADLIMWQSEPLSHSSGVEYHTWCQVLIFKHIFLCLYG